MDKQNRDKKPFFNSTGVRVVLAIVFVVALVFAPALLASFSRYQTPQKEAVRAAAFSHVTASLKQQARAAMKVESYPEQENAITAVGKKLQAILASDESTLLTDDTFTSDEFSVTITNYPLSGGRAIRRITYVMHNSKDTPPDYVTPDGVSRFFLEYQDTVPRKQAISFSEVEGLDPDEKEFKVYENKAGCYAFVLTAQSDYPLFGSNDSFTDYFTDIYKPQGKSFMVKTNVKLPLKITADDTLQLEQQQGTIKGAVYHSEGGTDGEPTCLFNSTKLSFELPKQKRESTDTVNYDLPGLLLGLSDHQGDLRTLFIYKEEGKICYAEYPNQIIFPHDGQLFALKDYTCDEKIKSDDPEEMGDPAGEMNFNKLLCAPLCMDASSDFEKVFSPKPKYGFYDLAEVPLYVGPNYICYIQNMGYSGGGTFHWDTSDVRFDPLDDLTKFRAQYTESNLYDLLLKPSFKETSLADLLYGAKAKDLVQSDVETYGGTLHPYVDFSQLALTRNVGKWSVMLPVKSDYFHPGNGSSSTSIEDFAVYSNAVPASLTANGGTIELGNDWETWDAKDNVKFPGGAALLAQHDYTIDIGGLVKDDPQRCDLSLPVSPDEYIVSINFADAATQKTWTDQLNNVSPQDGKSVRVTIK